MNSSIKSIYIPRMLSYHGNDTIQQIMNNNCIGRISHIDFTHINKKPGFNEINDGSNMMSAFIHFKEEPLLTDHLDCNNSYLINGTSVRVNKSFWDLMINKKSYKIYVSNTEYWICLINNTPIKRTIMNIHQVVENGRYLEKLMEEQENKLLEQEYKLQEQDYKLQEQDKKIYLMDKKLNSLILSCSKHNI